MMSIGIAAWAVAAIVLAAIAWATRGDRMTLRRRGIVSGGLVLLFVLIAPPFVLGAYILLGR